MDWTACPIDGIPFKCGGVARRSQEVTEGHQPLNGDSSAENAPNGEAEAGGFWFEGKEQWRQLRMPRPPRSPDMWIVEPLESRLLVDAGGLALGGGADFQPLSHCSCRLLEQQVS